MDKIALAATGLCTRLRHLVVDAGMAHPRSACYIKARAPSKRCAPDIGPSHLLPLSLRGCQLRPRIKLLDIASGIGIQYAAKSMTSVSSRDPLMRKFNVNDSWRSSLQHSLARRRSSIQRKSIALRNTSLQRVDQLCSIQVPRMPQRPSFFTSHIINCHPPSF